MMLGTKVGLYKAGGGGGRSLRPRPARAGAAGQHGLGGIYGGAQRRALALAAVEPQPQWPAALEWPRHPGGGRGSVPGGLRVGHARTARGGLSGGREGGGRGVGRDDGGLRDLRGGDWPAARRAQGTAGPGGLRLEPRALDRQGTPHDAFFLLVDRVGARTPLLGPFPAQAQPLDGLAYRLLAQHPLTKALLVSQFGRQRQGPVALGVAEGARALVQQVP
jgi:hypothetical protein